MKFVGLDLGGVNSRVCTRDDTGTEVIRASAYPDRPSVLLMPIIRNERLLAGDDSFRSERGSGQPWPPVAMAELDGWSRATPPIPGGRVLLATIWQRLNAGGQWSELQWHPPDGLPVINKPTPAECVNAEVRTLLRQALCDNITAQVALAIPNQLPEESQESLLGRLPAGARLVWRSVAAAMSWADMNASHIRIGKRLAVLDVGIHGVEVSVFEFRQHEMDGRTFHVPVRRPNSNQVFKTGTLLADSPAPFSNLRPELAQLERHLGEISKTVGEQSEILICGPLADPFLALLQRRFSQFLWPVPEANAVARGSCLFAWRLARGWPTYLDVLPSLELFTLTEEHEPKWLPLIPTDCEVSGGQDFRQILKRRILIEKGTARLASWLQRSGEADFRKLSTDLPAQAAHNACLDLNVSARSAGGFARVRITPSPEELSVFGTGQSVLLNWQSMERIAREPKEKWPKGMVKFGWPACGKLYAHRPIFEDFLITAEEQLTQALEHRTHNQRMASLGLLKLRAAKTIAPHLAGVMEPGGDAAPVNQLVCFSTESPCEFMEGGNPLANKDGRTHKIAKLLWRRLTAMNADARAVPQEISAVIYILGRMGGYAPEAFQDFLASEIHPVTNAVRLFAAGRVLQTSDHGRRLFLTVKEKADFGQMLNNNWLRMLVYVLYQRSDVLREVPRQHVVAATSVCLDVFEAKVEQRNVRLLFMNSLRALALLLRARRHAQARDFLCPDTCPQEEAYLAKRFGRVLRQAKSIHLRPGPLTLVERVTEWLNFVASTDEMPPIAPPDEDGDAEGLNDE